MEVIFRLVNMQLLNQDKKSSPPGKLLPIMMAFFTHYHKMEQIRGLVFFKQRKATGNKSKD